MEGTISSLALGLAITIITRLSTKWNVRKSYVAMLVALLLGGAYAIYKHFIGGELQQEVAMILASSYGFSNTIYEVIVRNVLKK